MGRAKEGIIDGGVVKEWAVFNFCSISAGICSLGAEEDGGSTAGHQGVCHLFGDMSDDEAVEPAEAGTS